MKNQQGQVILMLILVMTVALAIGLSVIQRSLSDISTSGKVEQSSRAFSAAEAGIEKALRNDFTGASFTDASATVTGSGEIPTVPSVGTRQDPLEYPPLAKEEVAQVWLADYTSLTNPPPTVYINTSLDVYWGNSDTDKAALEVTLVYYDGTKYANRKWYLDNAAASRSSANNFDQVTCTGSYSLAGYKCKKTLGDTTGINNGVLPTGLILLRARLLYNSTSQPFAVQAVGTCSNCSLPPQARIIESIGIAGETQRKIQLFQLYKVVPPYFDYGIFSVGEINKN